MEAAGEKSLTKRLLADAGVPVPRKRPGGRITYFSLRGGEVDPRTTTTLERSGAAPDNAGRAVSRAPRRSRTLA